MTDPTNVNRHNAGVSKEISNAIAQEVKYDSKTGLLWRRSEGGQWVRPAFRVKMQNGYLKGCFKRREFLAHRVAWFLHYGQWPDGDIDHQNGDRTDNRIRNLRNVSRAQNMMNKRIPKNRIGVLGVYMHKASGLYHARIQVGKKTHSLGYFKDLESARLARAKAQVDHGFHKNHRGVE